MEDYKVKLHIFEGPLDLLLHLVKINEMDIQDIKIAEITRQYLEYIRLMQHLDLEVAGDFIVMAATLLAIKVRSLLPETGETHEDEEEIADIQTAQALMEQLIQYRKFKEAAYRLDQHEDRASRIFFRETALPQFASVDDAEIRGDLDKMLEAFSRVLRFVEARGWHQVTEEEFSVEEKIDTIHNRVQAEHRIDLESLFMDCRSKVEMIVTLLALLELCKQKSVMIHQSEPFTHVYIFRRDVLSESPNKEQVSSLSPEDEIPDRPTADIVEIAGQEEGLDEDDDNPLDESPFNRDDD